MNRCDLSRYRTDLLRLKNRYVQVRCICHIFNELKDLQTDSVNLIQDCSKNEHLRIFHNVSIRRNKLQNCLLFRDLSLFHPRFDLQRNNFVYWTTVIKCTE